jgi:hypothetical protein
MPFRDESLSIQGGFRYSWFDSFGQFGEELKKV